MDASHQRMLFPHAQRYLIAGVFALIPLWVTWVVFNFVLEWLAQLGRPWVYAMAGAVEGFSPALARWLYNPWFEWGLGILLMLALIYILGWATTRVLGRRLLDALEALLERIPLVKAIYGATRKFVSAFQAPLEGAQRVVLIDFPQKEMKCFAFVTRTMTDRDTGRELAVVYVPTTPNPTSGYTEILPMERVTPTDWSVEEAMRFIITGGTSARPQIAYGDL